MYVVCRSLSHILLIKPRQHDEALSLAFSESRLTQLYKSLRDRYLDKNVKLCDDLFLAMKKIVEVCKEKHPHHELYLSMIDFSMWLRRRRRDQLQNANWWSLVLKTMIPQSSIWFIIGKCGPFTTAADFYPTRFPISSISGLPRFMTDANIGEFELITSFLDPILRPLLHDPDQMRLLRW